MTSNFFYDNSTNTSGKPNTLKQYNQRLVISRLQNCDFTTAAGLSQDTGLSKTTISKILTELAARNLIQLVGKGDSTSEGGKKPELFSLNAAYAMTIVLSLFNSHELHCSVANLRGAMQWERHYLLSQNATYEEFLNTSERALSQAFTEAKLADHQICGIAIGYNGVADTDKGSILYPADSAQAQFYPLCRDLRSRLSLDAFIYVDSIGHFSSYAELPLEESKDINTIAVIFCGQFVTGSILSSTRQRPGSRGIVGEFGHLILDPSAPATCYCGSKGCLESLISERAILAYGKKISLEHPFSKLARKIQEQPLTIEDILAAVKEKDSFALAVLRPIPYYLSILIRNLVVLESVSKIIIQGSYVQAGPEFLTEIKKNVEQFGRNRIPSNLVIEFSKWSLKGADALKEACVYGAACYTSNYYLDNLVAEWFAS